MYYPALLLILLFIECNAQSNWTQRANYAGGKRLFVVCFTIGNKAYVGTGLDSNNTKKNDFWEYDISNDTWTQKATFPGAPRFHAIAFSIGTKGYIGGGQDANNFFSDFYEYDPGNNTWTQKASIGGFPRGGAAAFSIGLKGYVATGAPSNSIGSAISDLWEYNPITNSWSSKANFPGVARVGAAAFTIGNKGYFGLGFNGSSKSDFWEYDPTTNSWLQKASFPSNRSGAVGFNVNGKGYIGLGQDTTNYALDFFEYNSQNNTWSSIGNFGGSNRATAFAFSTGTRAYVGTGAQPLNLNFYNDFYELTYIPSAIKTVFDSDMFFKFYPNPTKDLICIEFRYINSGKVSLLNSLGEVVHAENFYSDKININAGSFPRGYYCLKIQTENGFTSRSLLIN